MRKSVGNEGDDKEAERIQQHYVAPVQVYRKRAVLVTESDKVTWAHRELYMSPWLGVEHFA
jgi:hypothetical protein